MEHGCCHGAAEGGGQGGGDRGRASQQITEQPVRNAVEKTRQGDVPVSSQAGARGWSGPGGQPLLCLRPNP